MPARGEDSVFGPAFIFGTKLWVVERKERATRERPECVYAARRIFFVEKGAVLLADVISAPDSTTTTDRRKPCFLCDIKSLECGNVNIDETTMRTTFLANRVFGNAGVRQKPINKLIYPLELLGRIYMRIRDEFFQSVPLFGKFSLVALEGENIVEQRLFPEPGNDVWVLNFNFVHIVHCSIVSRRELWRASLPGHRTLRNRNLRRGNPSPLSLEHTDCTTETTQFG